jgi:hypothetical protein
MEVRLLPLVETLAPAVEKNAPNIDRFIQALGNAAEYLIANPFKGIAAIISAGVAKDLASAGIQKAAEKALASSLGQAGIIAASAAVAIQVGTIVIDDIAKKDAADVSKNFGDSTKSSRKRPTSTSTPREADSRRRSRSA